MESNWRWNVWRYGLNPAFFSLAARYPGPPPFERLYCLCPLRLPFVSTYIVSVLNGYGFSRSFQNFHLTTGFPYGWPGVEPDHP